MSKVRILLVVMTIGFYLQVNAIPVSNPMVMTSHSVLVDNRMEEHDKSHDSKRVEMMNSNAAIVAFPSKNILLGIVLIGVYFVFVRKNIGSRNTDL